MIEFPPGVWETTQTLVLPRNVSLRLSPGTVIRASATIAGPLIDTESTAWEGQFIEGGVLDCNLLAQDGLRIRVGRYCSVRNVQVDDPTRHGVILGDTGLSASSFEVRVDTVTVRRRTGQAIVAGAKGFDVTTKCSDSTFDRCVAIGFETGFSNAGGDNRYRGCHAWGFPGGFPVYAFDDASGSFSTYVQCVADSPTNAGFRLRVGYAVLAECVTFLAASQTDNTVVGVRLDASASNVTAVGCRFQGASVGVRLAADFLGADTTWKATSTVTGQLTFNTVAPLPTRNMIAPYSLVGQTLEKSLYLPGAAALGDHPVAVFWPVPVQVDSVVIRAGSGTGAQFQVWQGGTQISATFNLGDNAVFTTTAGTGSTPVTLAANAGIYIKVTTAGTGMNLTAVFKARQNG